MKKVFLISWVIFIIATNCFWVFKNNIPPAWDQASYLSSSEVLYQTLRGGNFSQFLNMVLTTNPTKPPLLVYSAVPLYLLFGSGPQIALMVNVIALIFFVIFFYILARLFFNDKLTIISLVILTTMPLFYGLMRQFFVEFMLMTLTIAFVYFLIKSKHLTQIKYTPLAGLFFGLGMMTKFTFFVFILGPCIFELWYFIKNQFSFKKLVITAVLFSIPALTVTVPWYSHNILTVLWHAKRATNPELLGRFYYGPPFSLRVIYLTLLDNINFVISGFYSLLILILSIWLLIKKGFKINWYLLLWFAIPFLVFFFGANKDYRFILPLLPLIALYLAYLINQLKLPSFVLILLLIPTLIYLNTTLVKPIINQNISLDPIIISSPQLNDYVYSPKDEDWKINNILSTLNNLDPQNKTVILASENDTLNINNLEYYRIKGGYKDISLKTASYFPTNTSDQKINEFVSRGNYLIFKSGGLLGPSDLNRLYPKVTSLPMLSNWAKIDNNVVFPDGGKLIIYRNETK